MNSWQPIETAPEERKVLVAIPCGYGTGKIHKIFMGSIRDGEWVFTAKGHRGRKPSHWMPLPELPNG